MQMGDICLREEGDHEEPNSTPRQLSQKGRGDACRASDTKKGRASPASTFPSPQEPDSLVLPPPQPEPKLIYSTKKKPEDQSY